MSLFYFYLSLIIGFCTNLITNIISINRRFNGTRSFVHAYEVVRPIVLKAGRQIFHPTWDRAGYGARGAMMTLYQLESFSN